VIEGVCQRSSIRGKMNLFISLVVVLGKEGGVRMEQHAPSSVEATESESYLHCVYVFTYLHIVYALQSTSECLVVGCVCLRRWPARR
jgi:hypothetical protein